MWKSLFTLAGGEEEQELANIDRQRKEYQGAKLASGKTLFWKTVLAEHIHPTCQSLAQNKRHHIPWLKMRWLNCLVVMDVCCLHLVVILCSIAYHRATKYK
jgi:hypothetical protein